MTSSAPVLDSSPAYDVVESLLVLGGRMATRSLAHMGGADPRVLLALWRRVVCESGLAGMIQLEEHALALDPTLA